MTLEVRAVVRRFPRVGGTPKGENWMACAYTVSDDSPGPPDTYEFTWSATVTEAIIAALEMRAALERQLMDEVHKSRAKRRESGHVWESCTCTNPGCTLKVCSHCDATRYDEAPA
jgi:hypothetical protein